MSYTPSGYYGAGGGGSTIQDQYMTDVANRVQIVYQSTPWLASDPETVRQLALSNIPTYDLARNAATLAATVNADKMAANLARQSKANQRLVWANMADSTRQSLVSIGYEAPEEDSGGGFAAWSGPLSAVGDALGMGLRAVNSAINAPGIKQGLDFMAWAGDQPAHLYRTIRMMDDNAQWAGLLGAAVGLAGVAAAPFSGGLSLMATAGVLGGGALLGATAGAALTSPHDWVNAWNTSWDGERVFTVGAQRKAREILQSDRLTGLAKTLAYDGDLTALATDLAGHRDAANPTVMMRSLQRFADDLAAPGDPRRDTVMKQLVELTNAPEFQEAVRVLQDGKISFGRDIARTLGLRPGDTGYGLLSGAMDAAFVITLDPFLAAGSAFQFARARKFGFNLEGVTDLAGHIAQRADDVPAIGRALDEAADAIDKGQFGRLYRNVNSFKDAWIPTLAHANEMKAAGKIATFGRAELIDYIAQGEGLKMMLSGAGVRHGTDMLMLPRYGYSVLGHTINPQRATNWMKGVIDIADSNRSAAAIRRRFKDEADAVEAAASISAIRSKSGYAYVDIADAADLYRRTRAAMDILDKVPVANVAIRQAGAFAGSLTSMLPAHGAIRFTGSGTADDLYRFTEMGRIVGMSDAQRQLWRDTIMNAKSVAERQDVAVSFLDSLITLSGGRATPEMSGIVDDFLARSRQAYSTGEIGRKMADGSARRRGVLLTDRAVEMPYPNMKELQRAARKGTIMQVANRVTGSAPVEGVMNVWKPAVLLRIGFIPRNAGEEILSFMARNGPTAYFRQFGLRAVAEGQVYDEYAVLARRWTDAGLTSEQVQEQLRHIGRLKYVAHVRPIERILSGSKWTEPWVDALDTYSRTVRRTLGEGVAPTLPERIPAKFRTAVAGRPESLRRMVIAGADADRVAATKLFVQMNGGSVLRNLSAHEANLLDATNRFEDTFEVPTTDPKTGRVTMQARNVKHGTYVSYGPDDPAALRMASFSTSRLVDDPLHGPVIAHVRAASPPISMRGAGEALIADVDSVSERLGHDLVGQLFHEVLHPDKALWDGTLRAVATRGDLGADAAQKLAGAPDAVKLVKWVRGNRKALGYTTEEVEMLDDVLKRAAALNPEEASYIRGRAKYTATYGPNAQPVAGTLEDHLAARVRQSGEAWYDFDRRITNGIHPDAPYPPPNPMLTQAEADLYSAEVAHDSFLRDVDPGTGIHPEARKWQAEQGQVGPPPDAAEMRVEAYEAQQQIKEYERQLLDEEDIGRRHELMDYIDAQKDRLRDALRGTMQSRSTQNLDTVAARATTERMKELEMQVREARTAVAEARVVDASDQVVLRQEWTEAKLNDLLTEARTASDDYAMLGVNAKPLDELQARLVELDRQVAAATDPRERLLATWDRDRVRAQIDIWYPETIATGRIPQPPVIPDNAIGGAPWRPEGLLWDRHSQDEAIRAGVRDQMDRVGLQGAMSGMDWQTSLADGTMVLDPLTEYGTRTYVPMLSTGAAEELVSRLATRGASAVRVELADHLRDFYSRLSPADAQRLAGLGNERLDDFLDLLAVQGADGWGAVIGDLAAGNGHGSLPLAIMAFDDAATARILSRGIEDYLMGAPATLTDAVVGVGQITGPTELSKLVPTDLDGFKRPVMTKRQGATWDMDPRQMAARVEPVSGGEVVLPNGKTAIGATLEQAKDEHARLFVAHANASLRPGDTRQLMVTSEGFYADEALTEPILVGSTLSRSGRVYDDRGLPVRAVAAGTPSASVAPVGAEAFAWEGLDPIWFDHMDEVAGTMRYNADTDLFGGSADVARERLLGQPTQRSFRAHYTDWERAALPDQILGPALTPVDRKTLLARISEFGFGKVIAPAMDAAIRTPLAVHSFVEAMVANKPLMAWLRDPTVWRAMDEAAAPVLAAAALDVSDKVLATDLRKVLPSIDPAWDAARAMDDTELVRYAGDLLGGEGGTARLATIGAMGDDAASRVAAHPWWATDLRGAADPTDAVVALYRGYLGDGLSRTKQANAAAIEAMPEAMRAALTDDAWAVLAKADKNLAGIDDVLSVSAQQRAIINGTRYIDSHDIRSQFGEAMKAYSPFWYAEENFLKRWGRVLKINPAAVRQGQLLYAGLKSGGVIQTDAQGKDWFVYPGSGLLAEAMGKFTPLGTVTDAGVIFAATPQSMLPGFDPTQTGIPTASPLLAVGLEYVTNLMPELRPFEESLVGKANVDQRAITNFVPPVMRRLWETFTKDEDTSRRYASAMMSMAAIMEAQGRIPDDMDANQRDEMLRELRDGARTILATQALLGFVVPGSPVAQYTGESNTALSHLTGVDIERLPDQFRQEFLSLVYELGAEEGTQQFLKHYPKGNLYGLVNPLAYSVAQSTTPSGAPIPATVAAGRWARDNAALLDQYPQGAAWLFPPDPEARTSFDHYTYTQQVISDLRTYRSPDEFLDQMKFKEGSIEYFSARDFYEAKRNAYDQAGDREGKRVLDARWKEWSSAFKALHPVFTNVLESGDGPQRRADTLDQLRLALSDPALPVDEHVANVKTLVDSWDFYRYEYQRMTISRSAAAQREADAFKASFGKWVGDFVFQHREVESMWLTLMRPDAHLT